ncbi:MAG: hypothetical protein RMJ87_01375 [Cytophagales bacterium]|nr:hypothetical protein [Bernardetiaceae bacterium]MDW8203652.1 hypothetical protein [Cytophagales bacterium]
MRCHFLLLVGVFGVLTIKVQGQNLTREFPYAGVTYRYRVTPTQDSSVLWLHIQALKNRQQGIMLYKGRMAVVFNHPRRWRITIFGAQKKQNSWVTLPDSYLETTFDLQRQTVTHFDNGSMVQAAEQETVENFSAEWNNLSRNTALATTIEYFIMNYNRAIGQHEAGEELETEEVLLLEQMMAERQAQRDSMVTALIEQRQKTISDSQATHIDSTALAANPAPAAADSLPTAFADSAATLTAAPVLPPPIRIEGNFELPHISKISSEDEIYFIETEIDEFNHIVMKIRHYNADSNWNKLIYVSDILVQDSTHHNGKYEVRIHLAENKGYEWKIFYNDYLACTLDAVRRKICYTTVGKLASKLNDFHYQPIEEELASEVTHIHKQDVLLWATQHFVKRCAKLLTTRK